MKFIKDITASSLFKVTSLNSISVIVRIIGGIVSSKIIAAFIGPAGLALTGNLRNFLSAIDTFSTLGFQNGIIKHVAEKEKDEESLKKILATVFLTVGLAVVVIGTILFLSRFYLSGLLFKTTQYTWILSVFVLCLPFYAGNIIFIAVLNGLSAYKQVIKTNISGNIFAVILASVLIFTYGLQGALLSLIIAPSVIFFFSCYLLQKRLNLLNFFKTEFYSFQVLKPFFSYSLMALVTAVLGQLVYFFIRDKIINTVGIQEAGYWEGINRFSSFYMMFVSTLLTVYFLPKLSQAVTVNETHKVFVSYFKGTVPVFALGMLAIYILKEFIIIFLLDKSFLPMENLFVWQLSGDLLKICSLILGYEFFAKKMTRTFIMTEVFSFFILYISSMYLIYFYGSKGAVMAHAVTYCIYLIVLIILFRRPLFIRR